MIVNEWIIGGAILLGLSIILNIFLVLYIRKEIVRIFVISETASEIFTRLDSFKLLRDSTQIAHGDADGDRSRVTFQFHGDDNENDLATQNMLYLDSPSSTSELTYKLQWFVESAGDARLNYSNSGTDSALVGRTASTMTVMEVLA